MKGNTRWKFHRGCKTSVVLCCISSSACWWNWSVFTCSKAQKHELENYLASFCTLRSRLCKTSQIEYTFVHKLANCDASVLFVTNRADAMALVQWKDCLMLRKCTVFEVRFSSIREVLYMIWLRRQFYWNLAALPPGESFQNSHMAAGCGAVSVANCRSVHNASVKSMSIYFSPLRLPTLQTAL